MIEKAMIMAAGVGSRLDPLTKNTPKPLVPVLNKPVMDILLEKLASIGIKKVIANTYYLAEQIQERYKDNLSLDLSFDYIHEKVLSGTAGGFKKCEHFFDDAENLVVLSADGLHDTDLEAAVKSHIESKCIATMVITSVPHEEVDKYGVVVFSGENKVTEFQEKPSIDEAKSNYINTGIYIFNKRIFDFIPENQKFDFAKNVFPAILDADENINVFKTNAYWSDIGSIEQYIQSNFDAINNNVHVGDIKIQTTDTSKYFVDKNTQIGRNVHFKNNVIIGKNCTIGDNVTLDNVILWDNVVIKNDIELKNVVCANDTKINISITDKSSTVIGANKIIDYEYVKTR